MRPFVMWAGGKGRLIRKYRREWFEGTFSAYYEPFLGGGSVFAWLHDADLLPGKSVLSDSNTELVGVYKAVRDDVDGFLGGVDSLVSQYLPLEGKASRKEWYYRLRRRYWDAPDAPTLFMLMRTGFNGIWQTCEESHGLYGTPAGLLNHTKPEQIYRRKNLMEWHDALSGVELLACDYGDVPVTPNGSLIYLDPPYRGSFTTYGTGFDDADQAALVRWALWQSDGGARVLIANREVDGDTFFDDALGDAAQIDRFDITYTAGRRKRVGDGYEAKPAREFLARLGAR